MVLCPRTDSESKDHYCVNGTERSLGLGFLVSSGVDTTGRNRIIFLSHQIMVLFHHRSFPFPITNARMTKFARQKKKTSRMTASSNLLLDPAWRPLDYIGVWVFSFGCLGRYHRFTCVLSSIFHPHFHFLLLLIDMIPQGHLSHSHPRSSLWLYSLFLGLSSTIHDFFCLPRHSFTLIYISVT